MLRAFSSQLIQDYVNALSLADPQDNNGCAVTITSEARKEVVMLKELTWYYVINNHALTTQQRGQKQIITTLFEVYRQAAEDGETNLFSEGAREQIERATTPEECARVIADVIASMSEAQVIRLYQRFTGASLGSVLDPMMG
jgi:dGTPase